MTDLFTPAERLTLARIELRARRYEHRLLKQAAKAGRLPSSRTAILRSMAHAFAKAFADAPPPATLRASGNDAANGNRSEQFGR